MLNHLRTLLLNEDGSAGLPEGVFAEEHVPAEYRPVLENSAIRKVRNTLFGTRADRSAKNYRLRQIMPLLHSRELEEYVLALDPRISYWPPRDTSTYSEQFKVQITQTRSADVANLSGPFDLVTIWFAIPGPLTGTAAEVSTSFVPATIYAGTVPTMEGQEAAYRRWFVANNNDVVSIYRRIPEHDTDPYQETTCVFTAGLSQPIQLPGSNVAIRMREDATGAAWSITSTLRPALTLAELLPRFEATIDEGTLTTLVGVRPVEPYLTFANLWRHGRFMPLRIGGLLMATGYRMHELWERSR